MKKKKTLVTVISAALLTLTAVTAGLAAGAFTTEEQARDLLRQAGRIETASAADTETEANDAVAYTGDHIKIMKNALKKDIQQISLTADDPENAKELALENAAIKEIFCYRAKEAGISDDDAAFEQWLASYRADIEAADNYSDFLAYVDGTGMTVEEYWDSLKTDPEFRKEYCGMLFIEKLQRDFEAETGITTGTEEFYPQWSEYFEAYKKQAVADEHLKKAGGGETE